jgi:hypothetical protein
VVHRVADPLVKGEDRPRLAGVERWAAHAVDATATRALPPDPRGGRIGQRRPVEERPDGAGIAEPGEQLRQDRRRPA